MARGRARGVVKKIVIYGASDDLLEIEDLTPALHPSTLTDEYSVPFDESAFVVVATTTPMGEALDVFEVEYTSADRPNGLWRVTHKVESGALRVDIVTPPEPKDDDEDDCYTERATVEGHITRTDVVSHWPPSVAKLRDELGDVDLSDVLDDLTDEQVRVLAEMVTGRSIPAALVVP